VIWDAIAAEAAKFRVYLNFINDKDNMAATARSRCTVVNEVLAKKPSEWAQNAIDLLNFVPTVDLQTIGVKDRTALIIWARRIIAKHNLLKSVQTKLCKWSTTYRSLKMHLNNCLSKASHHFGMEKVHYTIKKTTILSSFSVEWTILNLKLWKKV
jgi:hypothetical protein